VNIALAELLSEFGLKIVPLRQKSKVTDCYTIVRGIRCIIEMKEQPQSKFLQKQLEKRVETNMCELGIGLLYSSAIVAGMDFPSPNDIKKALIETELEYMAFKHDPENLKFKQGFCKISELTELIYNLSGKITPVSQILEAVNMIGKTIDDVVQDALAFSDVQLSKIRRAVDYEEEN